MSFAEAKAKLIGELLVGRYALLSAGAMRADMERERHRMFARYVALERQTMQVDFDLAPRATSGLSTARVRFPCPIRLHQLRC